VGAAAAATATAALSCETRPNDEQQDDRPQAVPAFEFDEMSVASLGEGLRQGRYTSAYLAKKYIERIEQIDKSGPGLNSVIEINPQAAEIAAALDRELAEGRDRGPLHGLPVLIKDNIATADRMQTTAGSLALVGSRPPADSAVATRLRQAGALILGKTNLSEWANYRGWRSTSGWSGRGGLTNNPYALDRNPSGSSSGSGVAAAASLCAAAVGTETDGSLVGPSCLCGLVGIKPTVGLVGRSGIIPISKSQDTAGPMARSVADAAALLGALAGIDPADEATAPMSGKEAIDYTRYLDRDGLKGARIGVARSYFKADRLVKRLLEQSVEALKEAGAELVDPVEIGGSGVWKHENQVMQHEFKDGLNRYLEGLGESSQVKSLAEVIEFNKRNWKLELAYFGQQIMEEAVEKGPLTEKKYLDALVACRRMTRTEGIDALMDEHRLDAIISPTGGPASHSDLINGDHAVGGSSQMAAVSGYPSITVPAGELYGLPIGLSFWGRAWSEPVLLRIAYAYEQFTKFRRPPQYLPTADTGLENMFHPIIPDAEEI